jgi:hypothetical protein
MVKDMKRTERRTEERDSRDYEKDRCKRRTSYYEK